MPFKPFGFSEYDNNRYSYSISMKEQYEWLFNMTDEVVVYGFRGSKIKLQQLLFLFNCCDVASIKNLCVP